MNHIVLVKDESTKKEWRFLNPLTEEEAKSAFIPSNCKTVGEDMENPKSLLKIPLINDGLVPLTFDPNEAFVKYTVNKSGANSVLVASLLVAGYCQNIEGTDNKIVNLKLSALKERLELLHQKASTHGVILINFLKIEKERSSPFVLNENLMERLKEIENSKNDIMAVVSDISIMIGKRRSYILSEFKGF